MRNPPAVLAALMTLCLFGCGDDTGNGTLIGATCENSDECDLSGACVTDGKGGICTLPCQAPGAAGACPFGAYCDRGAYTTDTQAKSEQTLCLPACTQKADCRDGYECNGVSSGPGKVCQPK
jgi:hypothetical protein